MLNPDPSGVTEGIFLQEYQLNGLLHNTPVFLLPHVSTAAVIVKNERIYMFKEKRAEYGGVNVFYVRLSLVKLY